MELYDRLDHPTRLLIKRQLWRYKLFVLSRRLSDFVDDVPTIVYWFFHDLRRSLQLGH